MQNYFYLVTILLIPLISIQASGNAFGQTYEDLVRIIADFGPAPADLLAQDTYNMIRFSLGYTNGSRLCPSNSCTFEFQGAANEFQAAPSISYNIPGLGPNRVMFDGVLRVGTPDSSGGTHYTVYDTQMDLEITETTQESGMRTHKVTGPVNFGDEILYEIYDGTLIDGGGIVTLDINAQPSQILVS